MHAEIRTCASLSSMCASATRCVRACNGRVCGFPAWARRAGLAHYRRCPRRPRRISPVPRVHRLCQLEQRHGRTTLGSGSSPFRTYTAISPHSSTESVSVTRPPLRSLLLNRKRSHLTADIQQRPPPSARRGDAALMSHNVPSVLTPAGRPLQTARAYFLCFSGIVSTSVASETSPRMVDAAWMAQRTSSARFPKQYLSGWASRTATLGSLWDRSRCWPAARDGLL